MLLFFVFEHVWLSVCLSLNLSVCFAHIYTCVCKTDRCICVSVYNCLCCLSGIQCRFEAWLPGFTVKCSTDWRGQFSNGAVQPLIFCLSSGVRLIYHASSPADIQIHFDWWLDRMTATAMGTTNTSLAAAHAPCHIHGWDASHSPSKLCSGYEYGCVQT